MKQLPKMKKERKATWWKLNILMVAMLALLFLITIAHLSSFARKLLEIGVIVLGFALAGGWIYANADALEAEAQHKQAGKRQPWQPAWRRPGLNRRQRHYLRIKHEPTRQSSEERLK